MPGEIYQFMFDKQVPFQEIKESMLLTTIAVESRLGRTQVRLDAVFSMDPENHRCSVDATSEVGRDIARIFTGFITKQFGEEVFKVKRKERDQGEADHE